MSFQLQMQAAAAAEQNRRMSMMSVHSGHGPQQLIRTSSNQSVVMMHPAVMYTHQQPGAHTVRPSTAPAQASQPAPRASIMSMDSVMGYHVAMVAQQQPIAPIMVMDPLPAPLPAADPSLSSAYALYHQAASSAPQIAPMQFGYYHQPQQQVSFELGSGSGSSEDPTSSDTVSGPGSSNGARPVSRHSHHLS
ncbi:hypothetical protein BCR44DRAFT_1433088 [Catenaria anguillulae PL171]|uniref:Uncharacterized protein n=1 Tax=Catenaria anguillulae PL171 TaxID=765915 RepID=A0A1Y2HR11_9FUNG|nr:hypothetical protein BCR44DRAFT_1433088 [Catenaria anguillulae PL171]